MYDKIFAGKYDGFLASCDLGLHKNTPEFWQEIIKRVDEDPGDMIYFDDKASLVELASSLGIDAHVYSDAESVRRIVGLQRLIR